MTSLQLGPLALPLAPLLLLVAWALAQGLARLLAHEREGRRAAAGAIDVAAVFGLFGARVGYVLQNLDVYRDTPLAMADVRDGGWHVSAGVGAALVALVVASVRRQAPAKAVGIAATVSLAAWFAGSAWLAAQRVQQLPAVALMRMNVPEAIGLRDVVPGRPMVVNLWATWCAPCREEMPAFARVQREVPQVPIVFVNQGESVAQVRSFLARLPEPLDHVLIDRESALGAALKARGLPTTFFVDAQGRIVDVHMGVMNRAALRARMAVLR